MPSLYGNLNHNNYKITSVPEVDVLGRVSLSRFDFEASFCPQSKKKLSLLVKLKLLIVTKSRLLGSVVQRTLEWMKIQEKPWCRVVAAGNQDYFRNRTLQETNRKYSDNII